MADSFGNYLKKRYTVPAEVLLVDKAQFLTLIVPETTLLIRGLRVLDAKFKQVRHGVLTQRPGILTNDFFVNLFGYGNGLHTQLI